MKRITSALVAAAFIAGCSSGVDLENVPLEDKAGTPLSTTDGNGANAGNTGQSGVTGVDLSQSGRDAAGPVGVGSVLYFDYDSYSIKPSYQSVIEAHARFINSNPSGKVMLEGHTDERGGREYNLALGQRRAQSAKNYLVQLGVDASRLPTISYGEEKPAVEGDDEAAWSKNRRDEFSLSNP